MPIIRVARWTPRGLMSQLLPSLFRKPKYAHEQHPAEPRNQRVPLDANTYHMHIDRKRARFAADLQKKHIQNISQPASAAQAANGGTVWSVATGEWVPRAVLEPTHVFSSYVGRTVMAHVMSWQSQWEAANGLLLPKPMSQALDDWAITIVPKPASTHAVTDGDACPDPDYMVRIMDPKHPSLSQRLYPTLETARLALVSDLEGETLHFAPKTRPLHANLYFHTCCCVWKREYLANPEWDDPAEFWERFILHLKTLWPAKYVEGSNVTQVFNPQTVTWDSSPMEEMRRQMRRQRRRKARKGKSPAEKKAAAEFRQTVASNSSPKGKMRRQVQQEAQKEQAPSNKEAASGITQTVTSDSSPKEEVRRQVQQEARKEEAPSNKEAASGITQTVTSDSSPKEEVRRQVQRKARKEQAPSNKEAASGITQRPKKKRKPRRNASKRRILKQLLLEESEEWTTGWSSQFG